MLEELNCNIEKKVIYSDNQGAIRIAASNSSTARTRHLNIKLQYTKNTITIKYYNVNEKQYDTSIIPRIKLSPTSMLVPVQFSRRQLPISINFANTINKSQGCTIHTAGIMLDEPCFAHCQLYTALSRVSSNDKIKMIIKQSKTQGQFQGKWYTRNVVWQPILQHTNAKYCLSNNLPDEIKPLSNIKKLDSTYIDYIK